MDWAALRKVMASQDDDYRAYYSDEELAESPAQRKARLAPKPVPKGTCPKCGKHIGKGVHFHVKACNG